MDTFWICTISAGYLDHPGVAVATARAGGVALLDLEFATSGGLSQCRANIENLLRHTGPDNLIGLRAPLRFWEAWADLAKLFEGRNHWLVLSGWSSELLEKLGPEIAATGRGCWLEARSIDEIHEADRTSFPFEGFLARGSECGGSCGRSSAFLLTQALSRQSKPFLVQGGIGLQSSAACRVAGAAGVVLEEQLLLMPESSLPDEWQARLRKISCEDTAIAGEDAGLPVRFASGPEFEGGRRLAARWAEIWTADLDPAARNAVWEAALEESAGWGPPDQFAWPMGQMVGFAASFTGLFRTTGRLIEAIRRASEGAAGLSGPTAPLRRHSALARSHGTEFPIVQGPMTRVSDRAEFAREVASAGALPMLALALLRREEVSALLAETAGLLGSRPWGVGILGFVPPEVRAGQLAALLEQKPPFALIAGGRPDQAASLEAHGIPTYLHVPNPNILKLFLRKGARRFVFEGAECGGHTGPFTSFVLWQQVIDVLVAETPPGEEERTHVLFAGGIHDALSGAMVSAMAAPLVARGIRVGVLVGTGYLFTQEAVASGAIVDQFQRTAVASSRTVQLETGVGHSIRCAPTPFTAEFAATRRQLIREGLPAASASITLDALVVGRSRAASKGLLRQDGGGLVPLDASAQIQRGLYMLGEVAALRDSVTTLAALHAGISDGSAQLLEIASLERRGAPAVRTAADSAVAIIGASCFLPGAQNPEQYWRNLLDQVNAIGEIPPQRFDWRLYFDANPSAPDKIYSRWGGFLSEVEFDPVRYGIPPRSLKSIALSQLLGLEAARRALDDAGLGSGKFDRENTAVIFGNNTTADLLHYYIARSTLPTHGGASRDALDRLPEWTEESFPGLLMNVTAGRVANRLDLGGPNFAVDAACASSLAALQLGVRELESGRSNLALAAGIDLDQTPYAYLAFSKTRALSPSGSAKPFDRRADGIVLSEGVVCLVLKRLADAERDGDRIYAVIRAVEGSSDGKGLGLTAPRSGGQRRALDRAYRRSGIDPGSIGLYEAHGTGTMVGDRAELETIVAELSRAGAAAQSCVLGSTKSLIGHTKAAAGLAGVLKAAMALYHQTLPPHAGVEQPLEPLLRPECPVRLIDQPQPWLAGAAPRRAGVSAFGFGGTNFHAVLEEYRGPAGAAPLGASIWPAELFAFRADSAAELAGELEALAAALDSGAKPSLGGLAFGCAESAQASRGRVRLAFVARDLSGLRRQLDSARSAMEAGTPSDGPIYYRAAGAEPDVGAPELAFLFPGQGSQYPGMVREFWLYLPEFRAAFDSISALLPGAASRTLRQLLLPAAACCGLSQEELRSQLAATDAAQLALGMAACAQLDFLERVGIRPGSVAGHSYGEYAALHAAGVLSRESFLRLSEVRGRAMAAAAGVAPGAMAAVSCARESLSRSLRHWPGVVLANDNGPRQCVISGPRDAIDAAVAELKASGVTAMRLPVGSAFHSPLMRPAAGLLTRAIGQVEISAPKFPVYSNADGRPFPAEAAAARARLGTHLESPVEFAAQIREMYQAGVRVFLELGPKGVLSGLVPAILGAQPHRAITLDAQAGQLDGLLSALAALFTEGVALRLPALFEARDLQRLAWKELAPVRPAEWYLSGGRVRHHSEPSGLIAAKPLVTLETQAEPPGMLASSPLGAWETQTLDAYREYQSTMRQFLATQEQVLNRLLERVDGVPGPANGLSREVEAVPLHQTAHAAPEAPPPVMLPAAAPRIEAPAEISEQDVARMLVRLVADRTGYAPEMLNVDHDIEAELGVDSLKRVEILAGLEALLPAAIAASMSGEMDRLMQLKSLRAIARAVSEWRLASLPEPSGPASCSRFLMREVPAERLRGGGRLMPGRYLITEDAIGVASYLARLIRQRGPDAEVIPRDWLESAESLGGRLAEIFAEGAPVRGIVHLASLAPPPREVPLETWRHEARVQTKSLFEIVKQWAGQFEGLDHSYVALAATMFGGEWSRTPLPSPGSGLAVGAGTHGILRSLAEEYPEVHAKVVDLDPALPPEILAESLAAELDSADASHEIGYPGGRRVSFHLEKRGVTSGLRRAWKPEAGWVVLATGGARGITSHLLRQMAAPGVRLILVGNTPLDDEAGQDLSPEAMAALRNRIWSQMNQNGGAAAPAEVESKVRSILHSRERNLAIGELRRAGAEVEYHCADVASEAFGGTIESVYRRFGRIDAVLHGAGVIKDQRLRSKSRASFDRIFDVKADSALILFRHLRPEGLRWVALFTSISARTGNRGQADYAAGNEVMNRVAWEMARAWPSTHVVSINWGPWTGSGMLTEPVQRALAERGFRLIDFDSGWRFLASELESGAQDEVEVIAGDGPWAQQSGEPEPAAQDGEASSEKFLMREATSDA